jgi:putative regulatory protein, FmdB family
MPVYLYTCKVCGAKFEKLLSFNDDYSKIVCPNGHSQVRKIYSAPSVIYRGSGWYSTDNRSKSYKEN